jgi:hypothetical protein
MTRRIIAYSPVETIDPKHALLLLDDLARPTIHHRPPEMIHRVDHLPQPRSEVVPHRLLPTRPYRRMEVVRRERERPVWYRVDALLLLIRHAFQRGLERSEMLGVLLPEEVDGVDRVVVREELEEVLVKRWLGGLCGLRRSVGAHRRRTGVVELSMPQGG